MLWNDTPTWGTASEVVRRVVCTVVPAAAGEVVLTVVFRVVLSALLSAFRVAGLPVASTVVRHADHAIALRVPLSVAARIAVSVVLLVTSETAFPVVRRTAVRLVLSVGRLVHRAIRTQVFNVSAPIGP